MITSFFKPINPKPSTSTAQGPVEESSPSQQSIILTPGKRPRPDEGTITHKIEKKMKIPNNDSPQTSTSENNIGDVPTSEEAKAQKTDNNKEEKIDNSVYASRKFEESWVKTYPWVRHDSNKHLMYCQICETHSIKKDQAFVVGSDVFHINSLKQHHSSKLHLEAYDNKVLADNMKKTTVKATDKNKEEILKLFKMVYFIAVENLSFTKFESLIEFFDFMDLKVNSAHYQNRAALPAILKAISNVTYGKVLESVKSSPYFGVMIDETTDIANLQKLIIYLSYWDKALFKVRYVFFKIVEIQSKTGESIYNELVSILEKDGLMIHKLIGISTDGASSMVGCHSGVKTRLIELNPFILSTHCIAHRMNLASHDSFNEFIDLVRFEKTVKEIYSYFSRSSKRYNELKGFQEINKEPILKLSQPAETRWTSLYNSIKKIETFYNSLLCTFRADKTTDGIAEALFQTMSSRKFLLIFDLVLSVLHAINRVIVFFQTEELNYPMLDSYLSDSIKDLERIQKNNLESKNWEDRFKQIMVRMICQNNDFDQANLLKKNYINKTIQSLKDRFPSIKILDCFRIFSTKEIMKIEEKETLAARSFGESELNVILNHFGKDQKNHRNHRLEALVSSKEVLSEWKSIRSLIWQRYRTMETNKAWRNMFIDCSQDFPNFFKLLSIILILPVSTVYCERGFSYHNITKNKIRNRLTNENVDNLMRIMLEGEDIANFDFNEAYKIWANEANRLINLKNS